jgi:DNA-binding MarR family transcriptional regulator
MASDARHNVSALDLLALYRLVLQAEQHLRAPIDAAAQTLDLTPADVLLLLCCKTSASGVSQRGFARDLSMSAAQVSGRLESLRKRGLLTSARPSNDRRKQFWTVTSRGEDLVEEIQRSIEAFSASAALSSFAKQSDKAHWSVQLANALAAHDSNRRAA